MAVRPCLEHLRGRYSDARPPFLGSDRDSSLSGPGGASESPKVGGEDASPTASGTAKVGLFPPGGRTTTEDVKASQAKGWTPWPTGLHAANEEKRKNEEEEKKRKKEEEQKKEEAERRKMEGEDRCGNRVASPPHGSPVEGALDPGP